MDTRFLASLICVIETGSIAGAARVQNLTAAAISQRIKSLENALHCTLLSRTGHSAKPTEACLKILPRLRNINAQIEFIEHDLVTSGLSGELRLGVISTLLSSVLPRCIKHLKDQAPNILLQVIPGSSQQLYQQLVEQRIDVAIIVNPRFSVPKVLDQKLLFSEPLTLIQLNTKMNIQQALHHFPYIQYDHLSWGGALASRYLKDHQYPVSTLCEIDALESIALMVQQGMGVSLVPDWESLSSIAPLLQKNIIEIPAYNRNIALLSHKQSGKEKIIKAFDQALNLALPNPDSSVVCEDLGCA